jgi:hypothetical protein
MLTPTRSGPRRYSAGTGWVPSISSNTRSATFRRRERLRCSRRRPTGAVFKDGKWQHVKGSRVTFEPAHWIVLVGMNGRELQQTYPCNSAIEREAAYACRDAG